MNGARHRWRRLTAGSASQDAQRGSVIPLVLGFFLLALILVAGSVAAGDAFVQQRDLQDDCDSAAIVGANSADLNSTRQLADGAQDLPLMKARQTVGQFFAEDPSYAGLEFQAQRTPDGAGCNSPACRHARSPSADCSARAAG